MITDKKDLPVPTSVGLERLKVELDLLELRKDALHLAMKLLDQIADLATLRDIGEALQQSAIVTDRKLVEAAYGVLIIIAHQHKIDYTRK